MTFKKLLPSVIIISLVSSIYVFLAQAFQIQAIWAPFISWSLYFASGSKRRNLPKIIIGLTVGLIIGFLTVQLTPVSSSIVGWNFGLSFVVFFMVVFILLMELFKPADLIPAYFLSYSSYFAYYYGQFGGKDATTIAIMPQLWMLLMLGVFLGFLTSELRKMTLKKKS